MKKKLFPIIIASAMVAGNAAAFDVTNAEEVNGQDLLAFYSGRQLPAMQTYVDFSLTSGAWRLRSMPSRTNYNFFTSPERTASGPSLLQSSGADVYQLSFSHKNNQLEMFLAYDTTAWQTGTDFDRYGLTAAGQYSFGDYYAATGFSYDLAFSDAERLEDEQRLKRLGVFMEAGKRFANLTTGLMYVYMNGDDTADGNDSRPFYLFSMANGAYKDSEVYLDQAQAISLYAGYDVGGQLNLRGGLGIAKVDERMKTDRLQKGESYRWAVNLDANYKLLDNLMYEAHFGFLDSGDLFDDAAESEARQPGFLPGNPTYHLINQLTLSF